MKSQKKRPVQQKEACSPLKISFLEQRLVQVVLQFVAVAEYPDFHGIPLSLNEKVCKKKFTRTFVSVTAFSMFLLHTSFS